MFSWLKFAFSTTSVDQRRITPPGPFDRLHDLVGKILRNSSIRDPVRSRLVCKSWRGLLTRPDFPAKPEMPCQITFDDSDDQLQRATPPGPFDRLPDDLVGMILGNLYIGDRVRMRLVCKSWRRMLTRPNFPVKPERPWQIMFDYTNDKLRGFHSEIYFYSIYNEKRIYTFKLPNTVNGVRGSWRWNCCGSSCDGGGWLLMAGRNGVRTEMMLWDPISGATRRLPALSTLPFFQELMDDRICDFTVRAQVFSVGSVECVVGFVFVFGINRDKCRLALCTPQDQSWSTFPSAGENDEYCKDILFHNGKLYMVHDVCVRDNIKGRNRPEPVIQKTDHVIQLSCCDVQVIMLELMYVVAHIHIPYSMGFNLLERWMMIDHLVGSSTGDLLIVSEIIDVCTHMGDIGGPIPSYVCPKTGGFEVRRLCVNANNGLCYLESTRELGDQIVLLGATGSTSVSGVAEQTNCIHFRTNFLRGGVYDDDVEEGRFNPDQSHLVHEIGVFYLADDKIQIDYSKNLRTHSGLFAGFFTPKLRDGLNNF